MSQLTVPPPPFTVVNPYSGRIFAQVREDGKVDIIDDRLRSQIEMHGIPIPVFLRKEFGDKSVVRIDDKDFQRAFVMARCWNFLRAGLKLRKDSDENDFVKRFARLET